MPPHNFNTLLAAAVPRVRALAGDAATHEMAQIPALKRQGVDTMQVPAWLESYLEIELASLREAAIFVPKPLHQDFKRLDEFFRASLR